VSNDIACRTEPDRDDRSAPMPQTKTIDAIRSAIQRDDLPWSDRRRLLKQEIRAIYNMRNTEIVAAEGEHESRVQATLSITKLQIDNDHHKLTILLRDQIIDFYAEIGKKVTMKQLEFVATFDEELEVFRGTLDERKMSDRGRKRVTRMIDDSFDRLVGHLERLARGLQEGPST
jgi:hypothetical protein